MHTAMKLGSESYFEPTSFRIRRELARSTRSACAGLRRALGIEFGERYNMCHEDLLRGPLSDEVRCAPWL